MITQLEAHRLEPGMKVRGERTNDMTDFEEIARVVLRKSRSVTLYSATEVPVTEVELGFVDDPKSVYLVNSSTVFEVEQ